jgi:hypothetical protein
MPLFLEWFDVMEESEYIDPQSLEAGREIQLSRGRERRVDAEDAKNRH